MAVRSKCLQPPVAIPAAATTIHTTAADETTLVKFIALVNGNAAARNVSFWINSGSGDVLVAKLLVPATVGVSFEVWWVMHPGWTLRWSAAAGVDGSVFGSELEGVAD